MLLICMKQTPVYSKHKDVWFRQVSLDKHSGLVINIFHGFQQEVLEHIKVIIWNDIRLLYIHMCM